MKARVSLLKREISLVLRVLSLGAGVQSSTLALMIAAGEVPMVDSAIFADTQSEPAAVYRWLDWLEKLLPFPVLRVSAGSLEADVLHSIDDPLRHRVGQIPFYVRSEGDAREGMLWRQCTGDYKLAPIRKEVKRMLAESGQQQATMLVGISMDEAIRMKPSRVKYIVNAWPLIELRLTRQHCLDWMAAHDYPLPAKSACYFCPYTNDSRWREMKTEDPAEFAKAVEFDARVRQGLPGVRGLAYLHRSLKPLAEVDFRNAADFGQIDAFNNECEGLCGT
jgi:hypothetical protein